MSPNSIISHSSVVLSFHLQLFLVILLWVEMMWLESFYKIAQDSLLLFQSFGRCGFIGASVQTCWSPFWGNEKEAVNCHLLYWKLKDCYSRWAHQWSRSMFPTLYLGCSSEVQSRYKVLYTIFSLFSFLEFCFNKIYGDSLNISIAFL